MSTKIKSVVSKNNPYWIPKERYFELKYFCLQYPIWRAAYNSIKALNTTSIIRATHCTKEEADNVIQKAADQLLYYGERMDMVTKAAELTDNVFGNWIKWGVINNLTYDEIVAQSGRIGLSRNGYYKLYRKFFYELNKLHY